MQIRLKNVTHVYDYKTKHAFQALTNVTTEIEQGEIIALIGHTGSGKTTFIEHLNALLIPTKGEVLIDKKRITSKMKKVRKVQQIRKKIGVVFQFAEYQLFEETVLKDIIYGPMVMGVPKDDAIKLAKKYIRVVGLDEKFLEVSPFDLSGGQKRRVAIAGILAMEPEFLVLDEPTAGLDPDGEKEIYKILKNLRKDNNTTIIVATHNMDHVLEHTDRAIVFKDGRIIYDGSSVDVLYDDKAMKIAGLDLPQITSLVKELESKGKVIGKPKNIDEFVEFLIANEKEEPWEQ